jgi:hypothetical protein
VTLRIITQEECRDLRERALTAGREELLDAKAVVNIMNSLFKGIDVRPETAKMLIRSLFHTQPEAPHAILMRMLQDLGEVDGNLSKLHSTGAISREKFQELNEERIGLDRVLAVLEATESVSKKNRLWTIVSRRYRLRQGRSQSGSDKTVSKLSSSTISIESGV